MEAKLVGECVKENPFKLFVPHPLSCGPVSAVKPMADDSFFMQMEAKMVGECVKENPFKLFVPHPLSCGPVSAVKPVADDSFFMQTSNGSHNDDLHVLMTSTPKLSKSGNQDFTDPISRKPRMIQAVEQENSEQMSQLYTKLFHEAEKINRWKLAMDNELWQKDKKLQENKHTIEVQRKAIQEEQFENENLSMRLEEAINKNEESTKKHNATRDLFSIVKEACTRLSEKMKTYEAEREESKELYAKNSENIEKMVMAFEDLRFQSDSAKKEIIFKVKEESEQREQLKNEYQHQLTDRECKVEQLQQEYKQKSDELKETLIHLQESKIRCDHLKEETRQRNEDLQKSQVKVQHLTAELEKTDALLKEKETSEKSLEEKIENMKNTISQLSRENEIAIEEFNKVISKDALMIAQLTTKTEQLEELFRTEQQRAKELQEDLQCASTDLEKKNNTLGQLEQLKTEHEVKISQLMEALENASRAQVEWGEQLQYKQTENGTLLEELKSAQKTQSDLEDKVKLLSDEKATLQKNVDKLLKEATNLKEAVQNKENVIGEMQGQILGALEKEENALEKINNLKVELKEERERHEALSSNYNIALEEKENILHNITNASEEIKNLQKNLEVCDIVRQVIKAVKQKEETSKKEIQILKDQNTLQIEEHYTLKETLKQQGEVTGSKLEEQEENSKNLQNEVKKKEKALKAMESKLNTLKKQWENKNKFFEELQKEDKSLKKQIAKETSQCSAYKTEIEQLKCELTTLTVKHKDSIQDLQKIIEEQMFCNKKLNEKVRTLQSSTEEAIQTQKKTEDMCQHKISEIITLMEKHKHQYDKMVEEKDAELKSWKEKEIKNNSHKNTLDIELVSLRDELSGVKQQLKKLTQEKESLLKQAKTMKDVIKSPKEEIQKNSEGNSVLRNLSNGISQSGVLATPLRKQSLSTPSLLTEHKKIEGTSTIQRTPPYTPIKRSTGGPNNQNSEANSVLRNLSNGISQSGVLATPLRKQSLSTPSLLTEHKQIERTSTIQRTSSYTPIKRSTGGPNNQTPPIIENTIIKCPMKPPIGEVMHKKRKVLLDLFMDSDSSEHSDIMTYTIRTPPKVENKTIKGTKKAPNSEVMHRKRKVRLDMGIHSDSSEHSDILSMIPENEMFKTLYKGSSQTAFLFKEKEQKFNSPAKLKSSGSALKQATIRKMREAGWVSITKDSRKKRMKAAEKLF